MGGPVVVASIGFSVDLVMRRVALGEVGYLIAVGLDTGDGQASRVESTYNILKVYLNGLGIGSELRMLRLAEGAGGPVFPVGEARNILAEALRRAGPRGEVELLLSGGPRMLVVGLLLAALTMRREEAGRIGVRVYGEGFPGSLEGGLGGVVGLCCLDPVDRRILELIAAGYGETSQLLERSGLARSTLFKRLRALAEAGLVRRDRRGLWRVDESVSWLL